MNDASLDLLHPLPASGEKARDSLLAAQMHSLEMVVRGAPLKAVLEFLADIVETQAGGQAVASIFLLDAEGQLRLGAAPSLPDDYNNAIDGLKARVGLGTCSEAAITQQVVIHSDLENDPNWTSIKHLPLALGLKAAWSQPIIAGDGRTLGTFGTYFRTCREPTQDERHLVGVLAHTAALAIERKYADEQRDQQERVLQTALDAAAMGTWYYRFSDNLCICSPRAKELYGVADPNWLHDEAGVRAVLHPDDVPVMWKRVEEACDPKGNGRYSVEYRVRRPEGGWRWLSVWGVTEFENAGGARRPIALIGASRDVTDLKEAEARQQLLVQELGHRVKNALAVTQALANQTFRENPDPQAFKTRFSERLSALARAHGLLSEASWREADIRDIALIVLEPFKANDATMFAIDGPPVAIDANRSVALSLILHELATNAAKYGALRTPEGKVAVRWTLSPASEDAKARVELLWTESGSASAGNGNGSGFGSKLIATCASQLGGAAGIDFTERGVSCRLEFPLQ